MPVCKGECLRLAKCLLSRASFLNGTLSWVLTPWPNGQHFTRYRAASDNLMVFHICKSKGVPDSRDRGTSADRICAGWSQKDSILDVPTTNSLLLFPWFSWVYLICKHYFCYYTWKNREDPYNHKIFGMMPLNRNRRHLKEDGENELRWVKIKINIPRRSIIISRIGHNSKFSITL